MSFAINSLFIIFANFKVIAISTQTELIFYIYITKKTLYLEATNITLLHNEHR